MEKSTPLQPISWFLASIFTLAILAVLVSKNSQSSNFISTFGTGFTSLIGTALSGIGQANDNTSAGGSATTTVDGLNTSSLATQAFSNLVTPGNISPPAAARDLFNRSHPAASREFHHGFSAVNS